jgi:hypothetical protein
MQIRFECVRHLGRSYQEKEKTNCERLVLLRSVVCEAEKIIGQFLFREVD